MMIDLVLPAIAIVLSSKLLRSEYCTNVINNHEMLIHNSTFYKYLIEAMRTRD